MRIAIVCSSTLALSALITWLNFFGSARLHVTTSVFHTERLPIRFVHSAGWPLRMYEFEEWSHVVNENRSDDEVTAEVPYDQHAKMSERVPCCLLAVGEKWLLFGVAANILVAIVLAIGGPALLAWTLGKWARKTTP